MRLARRTALLGLIAAPAFGLPPARPLPPPAGPRLEETVVRGVPLLQWLPEGRPPRLILFSHGANANAAKYDALTRAWATGGHAVAAVLHAESPDHPGGGRIERQAGWQDRLAGMAVAADELLRRYPGVALVAAGHSYGALVAQALGGARVQWGGAADPRVSGILAFSPPGPLPGFIDTEGWAAIRVPMFVATGTADVVPPVAPTWEAHRASFDASPVSPRWLWVGDGVDHYFGNRIGRPERPADANQARLFDAAVAASLAFAEGAPPPPQPDGVTLTLR